MKKDTATDQDNQRQFARLIHERNLLLQTVLNIRKVARRSPDEHMFFVGACDEALACIADKKRGTAG